MHCYGLIMKEEVKIKKKTVLLEIYQMWQALSPKKAAPHYEA